MLKESRRSPPQEGTFEQFARGCEDERRMDAPDALTGEGRRLRVLLEVGRSLVTDFDLEAVLGRVLEAARELTGARYAALGVLDQGGASSNAS